VDVVITWYRESAIWPTEAEARRTRPTMRRLSAARSPLLRAQSESTPAPALWRHRVVLSLSVAVGRDYHLELSGQSVRILICLGLACSAFGRRKRRTPCLSVAWIWLWSIASESVKLRWYVPARYSSRTATSLGPSVASACPVMVSTPSCRSIFRCPGLTPGMSARTVMALRSSKMSTGGVSSTPGRVASVGVASSRASRVCNPLLLSIAIVSLLSWAQSHARTSALSRVSAWPPRAWERQREDRADVCRLDGEP